MILRMNGCVCAERGARLCRGRWRRELVEALLYSGFGALNELAIPLDAFSGPFLYCTEHEARFKHFILGFSFHRS